MVATSGKKHRARHSQPISPPPSRAEIPHDWEKDEEELELEEALFGTRKRKSKPVSQVEVNGYTKETIGDDGVETVHDDEVF